MWWIVYADRTGVVSLCAIHRRRGAFANRQQAKNQADEFNNSQQRDYTPHYRFNYFTLHESELASNDIAM